MAMSSDLRILVIGGGAAGFFGAIAAARTNRTAQITILEAGPKFLSKVLISGGGRCNVTHACFEPARLAQGYPRGGKALRSPFSRFQPKDTIAWFEAEGVALKTEADGRMFPTTDDSATIAETLMRTAQRLGIELRSRSAVVAIARQEGSGPFTVTLRSGEDLECDRLLLATGSSPQGYRFAAELGHAIVPPVPSLFTFKVDDPRLTDLAGLAVPRAEVTLNLTPPRGKLPPQWRQTGPILVTHWGLSGPAILKLSAWGARELHGYGYRMIVTVNWLPDENPETARQKLLDCKAAIARKHITSHCPLGSLPQRLWQRLVDGAGIDREQRWADLSKSQAIALANQLTRSQFAIAGKGVFKDEFVTCGGVELKEVNFKTMESRPCPGLFLAGEILDVDGITGGFNFQNAWTTGWIAGHAIAAPAAIPADHGQFKN